MSTVSTATRGERAGLRPAWLADALIAGFVATGASTIALILAFFLAAAVGQENGPTFLRWLWELAHNEVVARSAGAPAFAILLHVLLGLFWAFLYALVAERRLPGVGWQRGVLFGFMPWLLSIFALLPAAGVGMLGALLSAGPLPPIGNLILHLIYGGVLGWVYDIRSDSPDTAEDATERADPMEHLAMEHSEGFAAAGILGGALVGAIVGVAIAAIVPALASADESSNRFILLAVGGIGAGAAVGAIVGSFSGLPSERVDPVEQQLGTDIVHNNILSVAIPILVLVVVLGMIVAGGSSLLTFLESSGDNKYVPVYIALGAIVVLGVGAWLLTLRQEPPRSNRDTVSHSGH